MNVVRPSLASPGSALGMGRILTQNSAGRFFMGRASVPGRHCARSLRRFRHCTKTLANQHAIQPLKAVYAIAILLSVENMTDTFPSAPLRFFRREEPRRRAAWWKRTELQFSKSVEPKFHRNSGERLQGYSGGPILVGFRVRHRILREVLRAKDSHIDPIKPGAQSRLCVCSEDMYGIPGVRIIRGLARRRDRPRSTLRAHAAGECHR
jgi:hypothetical protein